MELTLQTISTISEAVRFDASSNLSIRPKQKEGDNDTMKCCFSV